ncbi:S1 family peptidase [Actinomycetospora sp. TBRC 11914]|uniref:S1 family peptidase n=1 Tax=Actinomycetospora sp. TBRC 11914 TaxID=2729387 RepID=UPI00145C8F1D|nr:S1 family peptidase [Actinomycetospora sp. TBRC 11914]NMO91015.1 S1 family peptidase [Actinomycetospora sp. TBRC 11914]
MRPPRRARSRALAAVLAALAGVVVLGVLVLVLVLGVPALAATPTPPPPSGPGSTTRSATVDPRAGRAAKDRLDDRRAAVPDDVSAWWLDPATHQTVVAVVGPASREARAFAADQDPTAVRLQPMSAPVRPLAGTPGPLVGGTAITTTGTRCSDGFSARRGATTYLLTAGHCTAEGRTWTGPDRRPIGTAVRTAYPGEDFGIVQVTDATAWRGSGRVQGGPTVAGDTAAPTGSQVCRSGSTSGYHCGVVTATDVTVNYGSGTVITGLTQTTVCAEPGDSGGPFVTPDSAQAQGTLSGGTGDCTLGGTTYFQPLGPVLDAMGLTLVTGD